MAVVGRAARTWALLPGSCLRLLQSVLLHQTAARGGCMRWLRRYLVPSPVGGLAMMCCSSDPVKPRTTRDWTACRQTSVFHAEESRHLTRQPRQRQCHPQQHMHQQHLCHRWRRRLCQCPS